MRVSKIILASILMSACINSPDDDLNIGGPSILAGDTSNLLVFYSDCSSSQPTPGPSWCDLYEDGSKCCTWSKNGFHEEWCQYPEDMCWEMNGAWR